MLNKRQKDYTKLPLIIAFVSVVASFYVWIVSNLLLATSVLIGMIWISVGVYSRSRTEEQMRKELPPLIRKHSSTIQRRMQEAVRKNDYGAIVDDQSDSAIMEFIGSVETSFDANLIRNSAISFVRAEIAKIASEERNMGFDPNSFPSDGIEFEHWCARQISQYGWKASVTKAGGDQGIDLIAEKGGVSVGIQVKRYSKPAGNRSVQEAIAGVGHYRLDRGAVVATSGFTKSAEQLAGSNGIALLSTYDFPNLDRILLGKCAADHKD